MIPPLVIDLVDSFRTWHSRCQRLYVFRRHQFVAISIKNVKRRTHLNIRHFYRQRPMSRFLRHMWRPGNRISPNIGLKIQFLRVSEAANPQICNFLHSFKTNFKAKKSEVETMWKSSWSSFQKGKCKSSLENFHIVSTLIFVFFGLYICLKN